MTEQRSAFMPEQIASRLDVGLLTALAAVVEAEGGDVGLIVRGFVEEGVLQWRNRRTAAEWAEERWLPRLKAKGQSA